MNAFSKTKTTFRSKFSALGVLFLVLNFGVVWGQDVTLTPDNNGTVEHSVSCSNNGSYTIGATDAGTYIIKNNTGSDVTISNVTINANYFYNGSNASKAFNYVSISVNNGTTSSYGNVEDRDYPWNTYQQQSENFCYWTGDNPSPTRWPKTYKYTENLNRTLILTNGQIVTFEIIKDINSQYTGNCPSGFTATITTSSTCCPILTTPTDGAIVSASSISFSWEAYRDADSYTLYVNDAVAASNIAETSYTYTPNPTLQDGTYTWKVLPNNNASENCPTRTFMVCSSLSCVNPNTMTPRGGVEVTKRWLSWDPVPCATGYKVYVATTSVGLATADPIEVPASNNPMVKLDIMPEGEYYWVVLPVASDGNGPTIQSCSDNIQRFKIKYSNSENHSILPSTQGKEFYFSLMQNGYYDINYCGTASDYRVYKAIIAPKESGTVYFEYFNQNNPRTVGVSVTENTTTEVILNEADVYHPNVGTAQNNYYKDRTVRVYADFEISLYVSNEACNSFDASIVLPTTALGTEYMIQTYPNGNHTTGANNVANDIPHPCFMIIGTKDDTPVRITGPSEKIDALLPTPADVQEDQSTGISYFDITINKGESYFIRSSTTDVNDLSGIEVKVNPRQNNDLDKCKTIMVFNGNILTRIPATNNTNMDHIFEQAYPISNWGTEFAITSSDGYDGNPNPDVDYIRITASEATNCTIYNATNTIARTYTLEAGDTEEYQLPRASGSCYIKATKPVACYLYQRSGVGINGSYGDPSMLWISPINLGLNQLTFSTFDFIAGDNPSDKIHYVNIVIPADSVNAANPVYMTYKNNNQQTVIENITDEFSNYVLGSNQKYKYARIELPRHGTYTLNSDKGKMVVHVYGLGGVRGYAYNGGSAAIPYRSNFMVGQYGVDGFFTMSTTGYDLCSGTQYKFDISSNASNVYRVRMVFGSGDNTETVDMYKGDDPTTPNVTEEATGPVTRTISEEGRIPIVAYVYSIVYNNATCQEEVVIEEVEDYIFNFSGGTQEIHDAVCYDNDYTFPVWYYIGDSLVEATHSITFEEILEKTPTNGERLFVVSKGDLNDNGEVDESEYYLNENGCKTLYHVYLTLYNPIKAGAIKVSSKKCENGENSGDVVNISVTKLESNPDALDTDPNKTPTGKAEGGDPDAYYQWYSITGQDVNSSSTPPDNDPRWTELSNQAEVHTVTVSGWYRRAYISEKCSTTVYTTAVYATGSSVFDPGTHADSVISVCSNESVSSLIGTLPDNWSASTSNANAYTDNHGHEITFQWQKYTIGPPSGWVDIDGATGEKYIVVGPEEGGTFATNAYYRRRIANVDNCELNLDMGVYSVVVKPTFSYEYKVFNGCLANNGTDVDGTKIQFTITGGSGEYKITPRNSTPVTVEEGSVYEYPISRTKNDGDETYTFTITDADSEIACSEEVEVEVKKFVPLEITNFGSVAGCQGTPVSIPIPTITGGTSPYTLRLTATAFGINNVEVSQTTPYPVTIPGLGDIEGGARDINYRVVDALGCEITKVNPTITVYVNPALEITDIDNVSTCSPYDGKIDVKVTNSNLLSSGNNTSQAPYSYTITTPGQSSTNVTSATHSFTTLPQGNYTITVTSNQGCSTKKENNEVKSESPITITTSAKVNGVDITNSVGRYQTCPNSEVTLTVVSITEGGVSSMEDFDFSFDNSPWKYNNESRGDDGYSDNTYDESAHIYVKSMGESCGEEYISLRVRNIVTGCVETRTILIQVSDDNAPVVTGGQTINIPTYFCETFEMPNLADLIAVTGESCGIKKVDVTQTSSPAVDGKYNVAANQTNGITVTVKATNLCGKESAPAQIVVKPIPWPNFKINGIATNGTDNDCYCHGDNITLTAVLEDGTDISYEGASYQWYKVTTDNNGNEVATSITNAGRYSGADTKELKISSAISTDDDPTNGDDGVYKLVITDPKGCKKEATIMICVHPNIKFNLE